MKEQDNTLETLFLKPREYSDHDRYNTYNARTHTHIESRVTQTLRSIWERFKPTHSTKGNSQYHK